MDQLEIFDRNLRRQRRDRAASHFAEHAFLVEHMAEELSERLHFVNRPFERTLLLGSHDGSHDGSLAARLAAPGRHIVSADPGFVFARTSGGVQCDEDRLPFADASFDLVVAVGTLDSVNDLPGALALIRRVLRPDGLLLAAFAGAGSLAWLKKALLAADAALGGVAPRIHPQIDVRSAGDLLSRAGFALQVADGDRLDVGYGDPIRLMHDLRGMAAANMLAQRSRRTPGKAWLGEIFSRFASDAGPDGRLREAFEIVYLTGWSPDPGQPKPAKRGSATASLVEALKPRS